MSTIALVGGGFDEPSEFSCRRIDIFVHLRATALENLTSGLACTLCGGILPEADGEMKRFNLGMLQDVPHLVGLGVSKSPDVFCSLRRKTNDIHCRVC